MSDIERRQLGRTGLSVTVLGFGAMDLGGPPAASEISDDDAGLVLNAVLDSGINFIDTAVCYGTSEARIGRAISHRRGEFILATKCGCQPGKPMSTPHVHTSANIRAGVEHSLRMMRTDYLDIVQFHHSLTRSTWETEGALDELLRLKQEGKLRFIGVSGILPNLIEQVDSGVFDVFQIPYSALQREHEGIIAKASDAGAGIIIRGGVARGAPTDWNKRYYMLTGDELSGRWETAQLDGLLDGMSRIEFMVRFTISEPALDTTIIGTKNLDHLRNNVAAIRKGPLSADVVKEAKRRLDGTGSRPA
ncbi:aldo/keto reductase [Bradyrhizobium sp. AUGA SZCCT0240]|uniref:aldo/keto reductase n=1 Tax=Bradyrhizobium sp. AUGA SZCCT0240 TaxID=2807669 RepID=UPI001BAB656E|nr:aldo/keto reductase [Bradyrhizobium sp. AUGA SZCCT0240]MBR1256341.1 aldo/keto reductase [Bradyrhizobium sp. AUGA SZCCT0240]